MFFENQNLSSIFSGGLVLFFKLGFIILTALYFIFSLIVVRQVSLMAETVATEGAPIFRVLSLTNALLALGLIILFIIFL